jgi:serine/threonine protein kinase
MIVTGNQIFGPKNSEYTVLEFVGSGAFGTVYKVRETKTGEIRAVKALSAPRDVDLKTFSMKVDWLSAFGIQT